MELSELSFPLELQADAEYHPGYFYISLPFKVKPSISDFSKVELGTLLHEYTHYLQNVSTLWGLYETTYIYIDIYNVFKNVYQDEYPILDIPLSEEYRGKDELSIKKMALGRGSDFTPDGHHVSSLKLADEANFKFDFDCPLENPKFTRTLISFDTVSHGRQTIMFGAWYLKEAMAAIIQRRVDPSADERHDDIPYKLVERFVAELFPLIHADEEKLLAICYLSLFSMYPGTKFIELCCEYSDEPDYTYEGIIANFFHQPAKCRFGDVDYEDLMGYYHDLMMSIIGMMVDKDLKYLPKVIDENLESSRIMTLILTKDVDPDSFDQMVKTMGMPMIVGSEDTCLVPGVTSMLDAIEISRLIGLETCYKFLITGKCPQINQCKEIEGMIDYNCNNTPWSREYDCPLKTMADVIEISSKKIINRNQPNMF